MGELRISDKKFNVLIFNYRGFVLILNEIILQK